jgi:hypothetical protein
MSVPPGDTAAGIGVKATLKRLDLQHAFSRAQRYILSAFGPLSVSGAHFLATLVLLHSLGDVAFGQFSFALVVAGLCLGLTDGLLSAPVSSIVHAAPANQQAVINTYFKSSLVLGGCLVIGVFATMVSSGAPTLPSALFGVYGGLMSVRLFSRVHEYAFGRIRNVVLSDVLYSSTVLFGTIGLSTTTGITLGSAALVMATGGALALLPFGRRLFLAFWLALRAGSLRGYWDTWQNISRWSMLGVVTSEITMNVHAYLVAFIAGAGAFAPIAVGALFMRPFSLISGALQDQERPAMARNIANGDPKRALTITNEFRLVLYAIWIATLALTVAVIVWFPGLLIRHNYSKPLILEAVVFWTLISAVRGYRGPEAVLLQAAGQFKLLANASLRTSAISLLAALILLLRFGPVASLGGVLLGDIVMMFIIGGRVRSWKSAAAAKPVSEAVA